MTTTNGLTGKDMKTFLELITEKEDLKEEITNLKERIRELEYLLL